MESVIRLTWVVRQLIVVFNLHRFKAA